MKVYLICDESDNKARTIEGTPNCGVEYLGRCKGRILLEDGTELGRHNSSTIDYLRQDLLSKLGIDHTYKVIDCLRLEVPHRFKKV